jgi:hypothetical protein
MGEVVSHRIPQRFLDMIQMGMYFHVSHAHPLPHVTAVVDVHVFPNVELRIDILKQILLGVHPSPVTPTSLCPHFPRYGVSGTFVI